MKEDYLWNKTGSDPEIENLENVLKTFRHINTNPPQLPAQCFEFETESERSKKPGHLSLGMISFACMTIAVVGFGLFRILDFGNGQIASVKLEDGLHKAEVFPLNQSTSKSSESQKEGVKQIDQLTLAAMSKEPKLRQNRAKRATSYGRRKQIRKTRLAKPGGKTMKFTKEEKYAYDQLMLGLSIMSSNLKIVRDKIQGETKVQLKRTDGQ